MMVCTEGNTNRECSFYLVGWVGGCGGGGVGGCVGVGIEGRAQNMRPLILCLFFWI